MQLSKSKIFLIILGITLIMIALSIGLIFALSPTKNAPNQSETFAATDGNWTYTVTNNQATITAYSVNTTGTLTIPNTLGGYPVVAIDNNASGSSYSIFSNDSFSYVNLPSTITNIGNYVFYNCDSLLEINLPTNLTTLGKESFSSCGALTSITIPGKVTSIGERCFSGCSSLTQINFSSGITTITYGSWPFDNCSNITEVNFSNTMLNMPDLSPCTKLTTLTLSDSIQSMSALPSSLTTLTIGEGVKNLSGSLLNLTTLNYNAISANDYTSNSVSGGFGPFGKIGYYTSGTIINIGPKVQKIPDYLFYAGQENYSKYTNINFASNSVCHTIGKYTFYNCNNLLSINMPDSLVTIGENAFYNCYAMQSVTLGTSIKTIESSAFYKCEALSVLNFNPTAMYDCTSSVFYKNYNGPECKVNVGANVTNIPAKLCSTFLFKEINFAPNSQCQHIGNNAFGTSISFSSISQLKLPESLISIGDEAFNQFDNLTELVLPDSVQTVGRNAFTNARAIKTLTIGKGLTSVQSDAFSYMYDLQTINFNAINMSDFSSSGTWFQYSGQNSQSVNVNIGKDVKHIPSYLFYSQNTYFTSFTFAPGSACETIGKAAFYNNTSITSIILPSSVKSIEQWAFQGLSSCTSVYFMQSSNFTIGSSTFTSGNSSCIYYFASQSVLNNTKTNYGTTSYFTKVNFQLVNAVSLTLTAGDGCASVSGGGNYLVNSIASATAIPTNSTAIFTGWYNGNTLVSTANPYTFTINANLSLTASFELVITFQASTGGTVSNAGGNCTPGATITSTATPNAHYQFSHWIETSNGTTTRHTTATISITANYKASFVAYFTLKNYSINVSSQDTTKGIIKIAQNGTILDATSLNTTAQAYANYLIIASANNGYTFIGWQNKNGVIETTNPVLTINLLENKTYIAMFGSAVQTDSICLLDSALIASINTNTKVVTKQESNTLTAIGYTSFLNYSTTDNLDSVRVWATPSTGYEFACWAVENEAGQLIALTDTNGNLYESIADIPVTSQIEGKILIACFKEI